MLKRHRSSNVGHLYIRNNCLSTLKQASKEKIFTLVTLRNTTNVIFLRKPIGVLDVICQWDCVYPSYTWTKRNLDYSAYIVTWCMYNLFQRDVLSINKYERTLQNLRISPADVKVHSYKICEETMYIHLYIYIKLLWVWISQRYKSCIPSSSRYTLYSLTLLPQLAS